MYNVQLIHSFHCFEFIELTLLYIRWNLKTRCPVLSLYFSNSGFKNGSIVTTIFALSSLRAVVFVR